MRITKRLIDRLKKDETFSATPYEDAGGYSVGYGHFLGTDPEKLKEYEYVSEGRAAAILMNDINTAVTDAEILYDDFDSIEVERQEALVNMSFNMGRTKLKLFVKHIAAVNERDWATAAEQAKESLWYDQVGERAERVIQTLATGEPNV